MIIVWLTFIENILDYIIYKKEKLYKKEALQTIFEDREVKSRNITVTLLWQ